MPKTLKELSANYLFNTSIWINRSTHHVAAATIDDDVFETMWDKGFELWSTWAGEIDDEWCSISDDERYIRFLEEMLALALQADCRFMLMEIRRIVCDSGFHRFEGAFHAQRWRRENWPPKGETPSEADFEPYLRPTRRRDAQSKFVGNKRFLSRALGLNKLGTAAAKA